MTYDYWKTEHGRNSFDGNGATIKSYVHYNRAYDNAFWNGSVMTYGDGSGTQFDALTSLDVAAHEIGHAICEKTANLIYSNESGAMNEAFSDIWAASVEYFAAPTKSIWLIGEDIEKRAGHLALRSMSNPNAEGQPDTYKGSMWYTGTGDNGGVHTNSGVLNFWYYLLTQGGTGTNDNGTAYTVSGIGITNAAKIAFRLESVYLTSTSVYQDAADYGAAAAVDLFGINSVEYAATVNAFKAVGLTPAVIVPTTDVCSTTSNISVLRRKWAYYSLTVPSDATKLTVTTAANNGDVDLYVRYGTNPTTSTYNAFSAKAGSNETVTVNKPTAGSWKIGLYGYAATSGITMNVCYSTPSGVVRTQFSDNENGIQVLFDGEESGLANLYPNPTHSQLNINMGDENGKVEILSILGKVMMTLPSGKSNHSIDVSDFTSGVYMLVVSDSKGKSVYKFIKE